jgi:8-oxo-dGTP pyrophosphatase MutT (NUDIX family)
MSEIKAASTILLLRDRPNSTFEVFMVRRHGKSGFMAGAYVFPGGKLDDADCEESLHLRLGNGQARNFAEFLAEPTLAGTTAAGLIIAAIRETFEEAGVLLANVRVLEALPEARARLHAGTTFGDVLNELDAQLRIDDIAPLSRWVTPEAEPRRFDTRFFVAKAPADQSAAHDARETTEHAWLTPHEALARMERGEIQLPPPTLKTLLDLAEFPSADAVLAYARSRPAPYVAPLLQEVEGLLTIVLPGDPLHSESAAAFAGSTRIVLENGRFWAR